MCLWMRKNEITDDTRIRASLPTIKYLVDNDAKLLLYLISVDLRVSKP